MRRQFWIFEYKDTPQDRGNLACSVLQDLRDMLKLLILIHKHQIKSKFVYFLLRMQVSVPLVKSEENFRVSHIDCEQSVDAKGWS